MFEAPIIKTERLVLRVPDLGDVDAMTAFFADERSRFYGGPKDAGEAWRYLALQAGIWSLRGYGMFAVALKDTGETIGFAGPFHPGGWAEPEMSWLLTEARFEGQGYAQEAAEAALAYAFASHDWSSLPSFVDAANTGSAALAKRLGATLDPDTPAPLPNCDTYRHVAPMDGGMEAYA